MAQDTGLTAYWITFPDEHPGCHVPLGFGVTAWSVEDAFRILDELGYGQHRSARTEVRSDVTPADLDDNHVIVNSGPIVIRGLWYPFFQVGVER